MPTKESIDTFNSRISERRLFQLIQKQARAAQIQNEISYGIDFVKQKAVFQTTKGKL